MYKQILVLAGAAFLAACSSSSPSTTTPIVDPPGGTPGDGTRSGAYIGNFGSGNGVYVLSETNALSGLALSADGTAHSLFGQLNNTEATNYDLRSYFHRSSDPAEQGVFSAGEVDESLPNPAATAFNLNIVDGQTIESLSGAPVSLVAAGAGELTSSAPAAIAGLWTGRHRFCGENFTDCSVLVTEVTFAGTNVTGRTVIEAADGSEQFSNAIVGNIAETGSVSTLTFTWNNSSYSGSVFFLPGSSTQLAFLGETSNTDAGNRTIASLLTR